MDLLLVYTDSKNVIEEHYGIRVAVISVVSG